MALSVSLSVVTATDGTMTVAGAAAWLTVKDRTATLAGIASAAQGGTGIAFFQAAGPSVARTYTFPDADATILYSGGALGTPASGIATNLTGTAAGLTAGTASAVALGGITGLGTNVATALAVNVGSAGAFVTFNGALGTPSSGTLTNATGLPAAGVIGTALVSAAIGTTVQAYDASNGSGICEGRLTLSSGVPVTITDVTAAETLYFSPYKGNRIGLYDGVSAWAALSFSELSIDVPDATNCYDVYCYNNAGTPTLELTAWTDATNRATALTTQNGVLVKTGATTRRYLGTFYSTTAGNGQIEDSLAKRNLWNYYNRARRPMKVVEGTDTWTYTTATLRQANAAAGNQLEYVQGVSEDAVFAEVCAMARNSSATIYAGVSIGVDSTSIGTPTTTNSGGTPAANVYRALRATYLGFPGVGRHLLVWLEYSAATGTMTWAGDDGAANLEQNGITGEIFG